MGKGTVEIENLLNTKRLVFEFPEKAGAYLLVGPNGSGKSTLLSCIAKIGNDKILGQAFPHNEGTNRIDTYKDARITYKNKRGEIVYRKAGKRWNPNPYLIKKDILSGFGFPEVIFARVSPNRYVPSNDDLEDGEVIPIHEFSEFIENSLCEVFERDEYANIMVLRNKAGRRWFRHYYICKRPDGSFYSEKVFSTGELAVLRLLGLLDKEIRDGSLVLIDEFDMALHPKAQAKLYDILQDLATKKKLTIILSTHSASLISRTSKDRIIYLERIDDGESKVITPCYPANAMRTVDLYKNILGDYLFLVEDDMAQHCLNAMLKRLQREHPERNIPAHHIIPIGGFAATAQIAENISPEMPGHTKVKAVLDADAFEDDGLESSDKEKVKLAKEWKARRESLVQRNLACSLGFTPENELVKLIECVQPDSALEKKIREEFSQSLSDLIRSRPYSKYCDSLNGTERQNYKKRFNQVVDKLAVQDTEPCRELTASKLIEVLVDEINKADLEKHIGRIL